MQLAVNLSPPISGTAGSLRMTTLLRKRPASGHRFSPVHPKFRPAAIATSAAARLQRKLPCLVAKAIEQSRDTAGSEFESEPALPAAGGGGDTEVEVEVEPSKLGAEIKAAMEERKAAAAEGKRGELLSGVAEEVREIEWPAFQKVLGTTGVVLGVIAGSSVALLTVNFILAELSDRVFAGKGVQDFFG